jgi:hypothetical protein
MRLVTPESRRDAATAAICATSASRCGGETLLGLILPNSRIQFSETMPGGEAGLISPRDTASMRHKLL